MNAKTFADNLSQIFSDKINSIRETIKSGLQASTFKFGLSTPARMQTTLTCLSPITQAEVKELIQSAPVKTSPTDTIPTSLLKVVSEEHSVMIAQIANFSLAAALLLSPMKLGQVTPLLQKPGLDGGSEVQVLR